MLEFHGGLNDGVEYFMGLKMEIVGCSWDFIGIHGDWTLYQLTVCYGTSDHFGILWLGKALN